MTSQSGQMSRNGCSNAGTTRARDLEHQTLVVVDTRDHPKDETYLHSWQDEIPAEIKSEAPLSDLRLTV